MTMLHSGKQETTGLEGSALLLTGQYHTLVNLPDRDYGVATLSFFDSENVAISSISTENLSFFQWHPFELELAVPRRCFDVESRYLRH